MTGEQNRARNFLKDILFLFYEGFSIISTTLRGHRNIIFETSQKGKA